MRKLIALPLIALPLFVATLLLGGCEAPNSSTSTTESSSGTVTIAPRIVRSNALSFDLYEKAVSVSVEVYDANESILFEKTVPFTARAMTVPGIPKDAMVSILIGGIDADGNLIWVGSTGSRLASDLSTESAEVGTSIQVEPMPTTTRHSFLVGVWNIDSTYTSTTTGILLQSVAMRLQLRADGSYSLNRRRSDLESSTGLYYVLGGEYETGTWSVNGSSVIIQPTALYTCENEFTDLFSCDVGVLPGFTTEYTEVTPPLPIYDMEWLVVGGSLRLTNHLFIPNLVQVWEPENP